MEPLESPDDLVTLWGLVVEGFAATGQVLQSESDARVGRPVAELEVLLRLLRTPGHRLPAGTLARESSMTGGGLTRMVDRLVRDGLARRADCPQDRRVVWVEATADGLAVGRRARSVYAQCVRREVVQVLGVDAAAALGSAMRQLRDAHRENGAHAGSATAGPAAG